MAKILTLGEIMLRLATTNDERLIENNQFAAHFGGGEANVAVSLANFGHRAVFASKVPENGLGAGVGRHLTKYGVDTSQLLTGGERLGTYYLETGVGLRPSSVIYDRKYSSFATMNDLEWDLDSLFSDIELFHISGITPALSEKWQGLLIQLVKEAKNKRIKVSLDINYRGKLWSIEECGEYVRKIVRYVDYCSAGKLDALNFFKIPEKFGADLSYYYSEIQKLYPNIKVLYSTTREVLTSRHNRLQGNLFVEDTMYQSQVVDIPNIVDRVGGGDAFAAGMIHGLLTEMTPQETIDFATTASALKHSVHGDCNQFSEEEVIESIGNASGDVKR